MGRTALISLGRKHGIAFPPQTKIEKMRAVLKVHYVTYLEEALFVNLRVFCSDNNLPLPERSIQFHPRNNLELDFAWSDFKIAIEVQGGIDLNGRRSGHVSRTGMRRDMYKLNQAQCLGWILFQFPPEYCIDSTYWLPTVKPLLTKAFRLRTKQNANH